MSNPIFLDVNIPMYAAGTEHPYREACVWILREVADGRLSVAIDTEIIQEILHRYGALQRAKLGVEMASHLFDLIPIVYPITQTDARVAIQLFDQYAPQGIKARDVIHAAVMRNNGLAEIISTDKHFDLIPGLKRLDPQALFEVGESNRRDKTVKNR